MGEAREERRRRKAEAKRERDRARQAADEAKRERAEGRSRARAAGRVLAKALRGDPEVLARAVELGLVRREWVEDPAGERISDARASEVLGRALERQVEQRPSTLAALGLSALQVLAAGGDEQTAGEASSQHLAVVFSDLEGFTGYTAAEGDQAASRLLLQHQRLVGPIVRSRGGRIVKHLGDGVLVTFPTGEAAVLAALELVAAQQEPLRLRVGVHVGEVLVTHQLDLVGHVVNVAARVTDEARGGEVLTTAEVREAAAGVAGVRFEDRGSVRLKGIDEATTLFVARPSTALPAG